MWRSLAFTCWKDSFLVALGLCLWRQNWYFSVYQESFLPSLARPVYPAGMKYLVRRGGYSWNSSRKLLTFYRPGFAPRLSWWCDTMRNSIWCKRGWESEQKSYSARTLPQSSVEVATQTFPKLMVRDLTWKLGCTRFRARRVKMIDLDSNSLLVLFRQALLSANLTALSWFFCLGQT